MSCEDCAMGKVCRTNINKNPEQRASKSGERLMFDILSPTAVSLGGKRHWLLVMDDYSDKIWSFFLKTKSDLA